MRAEDWPGQGTHYPQRPFCIRLTAPFTRSLAAELAPTVRVNAIAAGPTLTEAVRVLMESDQTGAVQAVTQALPLQRLAEVDEIAEAVLFLASPRASVITGQVLYANCGGHMA